MRMPRRREHVAEQVGGVDAAQVAASAADRGADGIDDDDVVVVGLGCGSAAHGRHCTCALAQPAHSSAQHQPVAGCSAARSSAWLCRLVAAGIRRRRDRSRAGLPWRPAQPVPEQRPADLPGEWPGSAGAVSGWSTPTGAEVQFQAVLPCAQCDQGVLQQWPARLAGRTAAPDKRRLAAESSRLASLACAP